MPAFTATAPGKIILFGEHAVVYGRPAIAMPVSQVRARAVVSADPLAPSGKVRVLAPDIGLEADLVDLPDSQPLRRALDLTLAELGLSRSPACTVRVSSTIPPAAGLGSGAAVSVAVIRAFAAFLGRQLPDERVSAVAFEVEKLHHGTPSGVDNTVVTYARPVYFVRGQPIETLQVPAVLHFVIGDTGVSSPTAIAVGDVRKAWQADPSQYERLFEAVGELVQQARAAIETGRSQRLGALMDENQSLLAEMGVSSPELERLSAAARAAGALGAKLSGGGRGGNMIALVAAEQSQPVADALRSAGATRTIETEVGEALF
jgi:mevalonate kinase